MKKFVQIDAAFGGLYASTPPQALPFDSSLDMWAFLLRRKQGNLLVYSINALGSAAPAARDLGIARQYLNHWHEATFTDGGPDTPLFCHENDRESVSEKTRVHETFSERHLVDDDFEVIPTPGHTPGATAFLWDNGKHRCLFTSDTIYLKEGEWIAVVLESIDRSSYIKSLELIRELDFDVLVPWIATRGQPSFAVTSKSDARRRVDLILERVRQGADH
jgi:Cft2 family RNA processing exonuclease